MSVDTAAQGPAIRVEKHAVPAWNPTSRPDQTPVAIVVEKPAPKPEPPVVRPIVHVQRSLADQIKLDSVVEKPALPVEKRAAPIAFTVTYARKPGVPLRSTL